ncbi:MAG: UDP-3-O-(3-hydroxymyristoyl)glucosamine N-acyltransferase [Porticoccaceae bacterium]
MSRGYSLQQIAERLGAQIRGDADCLLSGLNTLQGASEGDLSFIAKDSYRKHLASTRASAVIMPPSMVESFEGNALLMDNPYLGYAIASALFDDAPVSEPGIHPSAVVAASAVVHPSASIGAHAVLAPYVEVGAGSVIGAGCCIGDGSLIGENCRLFANVSVYHGITIGNTVRIHSGTVIGADGFGYAQNPAGWQKIYQLGGVVIGDNVEIGACTTIDRGALDDTVIENGVIIDNHVMIAHNVRVGENTAMAACSASAGSTVIGRNCTFAGRAGVVGHVTLCDGVHVSANTTVTKSISEPGVYASGIPTSKVSEWRKNAVRFNQLDAMNSRIKALEKQTGK